MLPFLPTVVVVVAILWLTLAPHPVPDNDLSLFDGVDKVVHFMMFGGLSAVACFDIMRATRRLTVSVTLAVALLSSVFGAIIELLQEAMELGRSGDSFDFIADAAGAFICAFAARYLLSRFF